VLGLAVARALGRGLNQTLARCAGTSQAQRANNSREEPDADGKKRENHRRDGATRRDKNRKTDVEIGLISFDDVRNWVGNAM